MKYGIPLTVAVTFLLTVAEALFVAVLWWVSEGLALVTAVAAVFFVAPTVAPGACFRDSTVPVVVALRTLRADAGLPARGVDAFTGLPFGGALMSVTLASSLARTPRGLGSCEVETRRAVGLAAAFGANREMRGNSCEPELLARTESTKAPPTTPTACLDAILEAVATLEAFLLTVDATGEFFRSGVAWALPCSGVGGGGGGAPTGSGWAAASPVSGGEAGTGVAAVTITSGMPRRSAGVASGSFSPSQTGIPVSRSVAWRGVARLGTAWWNMKRA